MWRFIIVTITLALTTVVGRPLDAMEDPWLTNFNKIPRKTAESNIDLFKKWPEDSIDYDTGIYLFSNIFVLKEKMP